MGKPPAFQFYAADFLVDTAEMSAEETGAYVRLLCNAWVNRGVPADPAKLARIAGVTVRRFGTIWPAIEGYWKPNGDGRLHNPRLEATRQEQQSRSESASAAAAVRWGTGA